MKAEFVRDAAYDTDPAYGSSDVVLSWTHSVGMNYYDIYVVDTGSDKYQVKHSFVCRVTDGLPHTVDYADSDAVDYNSAFKTRISNGVWPNSQGGGGYGNAIGGKGYDAVDPDDSLAMHSVYQIVHVEGPSGGRVYLKKTGENDYEVRITGLMTGRSYFFGVTVRKQSDPVNDVAWYVLGSPNQGGTEHKLDNDGDLQRTWHDRADYGALATGMNWRDDPQQVLDDSAGDDMQWASNVEITRTLWSNEITIDFGEINWGDSNAWSQDLDDAVLAQNGSLDGLYFLVYAYEIGGPWEQPLGPNGRPQWEYSPHYDAGKYILNPFTGGDHKPGFYSDGNEFLPLNHLHNKNHSVRLVNRNGETVAIQLGSLVLTHIRKGTKGINTHGYTPESYMSDFALIQNSSEYRVRIQPAVAYSTGDGHPKLHWSTNLPAAVFTVPELLVPDYSGTPGSPGLSLVSTVLDAGGTGTTTNVFRVTRPSDDGDGVPGHDSGLTYRLSYKKLGDPSYTFAGGWALHAFRPHFLVDGVTLDRGTTYKVRVQVKIDGGSGDIGRAEIYVRTAHRPFNKVVTEAKISEERQGEQTAILAQKFRNDLWDRQFDDDQLHPFFVLILTIAGALDLFKVHTRPVVHHMNMSANARQSVSKSLKDSTGLGGQELTHNGSLQLQDGSKDELGSDAWKAMRVISGAASGVDLAYKSARPHKPYSSGGDTTDLYKETNTTVNVVFGSRNSLVRVYRISKETTNAGLRLSQDGVSFVHDILELETTPTGPVSMTSTLHGVSMLDYAKVHIGRQSKCVVQVHEARPKDPNTGEELVRWRPQDLADDTYRDWIWCKVTFATNAEAQPYIQERSDTATGPYTELVYETKSDGSSKNTDHETTSSDVVHSGSTVKVKARHMPRFVELIHMDRLIRRERTSPGPGSHYT